MSKQPSQRMRILHGALGACLLIFAFVVPLPAGHAETPTTQDPVAVPESATTQEDTAVTIDVLANDYDPDGDALTVTSAKPGTPSQPVIATDESVGAGIYEITPSWGANVGDFNSDGWPDLLLNRHDHDPTSLYRNDGGAFREVQVGTFPIADRHDCPWADVNLDGRLDTYCTIGARYGQKTAKANELWIQQADGSFVDRAAAFGVGDPNGRGRYATFIDVNHDPYPDLYVTNDYPRQDAYLSINRLFINQGGSSFRDAGEYGLNKEVGGLCVQAADYNDDGWEDLLVCGNEFLKLYRNNAGKSFTDVTGSVRLRGWAAHAVLSDLNGDGTLDLAELDPWKLQVRLFSSGVFQSPVMARGLLGGTQLAAGDVNRDRRPDLYVVQGGSDVNNPDLLLINDGGGTSFSRAVIPQTDVGRADAVATIDFDKNGRTDFIVLNGHFRINGDYTSKVPGPVQLISYESTNGTVINNGDGTVTYKPNRNFHGTDTFTYTISDGRGGTATATDTVAVEPINDAPLAVNDPTIVYKNTSRKIDVLASDTDIDSDALAVSDIGTRPAHGTAAVNADGTVTYTPASNYTGPDSFTYTVSDGHGGSDTATVSLRVIPAGGCTLLGADKTQFFYGSPGRDVICGRGGADFVYSHGGNDVLYGQDGDDILLGGLGNDKYMGGIGMDTCRDIGGTNTFSSCEKR